MRKPILSYDIQNQLSGNLYKHYSYRLFKRPFYSLKEKYYLEVETCEDGEQKRMTSDLTARSCSIETLFGRICFKPFLMLEKEKYQSDIQRLNDDEHLQNYFAWDTTVYLEDSYFHPDTNDYHFRVAAWHLNHVSACRRFLKYVCGEEIENWFPQQHDQSLVWEITPHKAVLKAYHILEKRVGDTLFVHPQPHDLFLLMASNNVFRHFFDWYAILTQQEGKHVAR